MSLTSTWLFRCYVWSACSSSEGIQTRLQNGANKNWRLMFNPEVSLMAYSDHGYGCPSLRAGGATSRKPGVLGRWTLRRTVQVRFGFDLGFRISDPGFLTTIDDFELNSSNFAICSLSLTSFSANFQAAFRNRRSGGTTIFVVAPRQFIKHPG
jgi:hypothetical protein